MTRHRNGKTTVNRWYLLATTVIMGVMLGYVLRLVFAWLFEVPAH